MARSMQRLRLDTLPPPYFIAYRVSQSHSVDASASFGSLVRSNEGTGRSVNVELRVGDYAFDNTNFMGSGSAMFGATGFGQLPVEDDYTETRRQLWLATDGAYKRALEDLAQKRAALRSVSRTEDTPDFSREKADTITDEMPAPPLDRRQAEQLVQSLSAAFRQMPDVFNSSVQWTGGDTRVHYLNSEGTTFLRRSPWMSVRISGSTQAADGAPLDDGVAFFGAQPADLPGRDALMAEARELGDRLARLRQAPRFDQYNGPVLLENQAAVEAFNLVFAPRLVATRRPISSNPAFERAASAQENPFLDQIGGRVLPPFMSATDDPTRIMYGTAFLGGYKVDDDGVPARATLLVERGILKALLNTRVPARGVPQSTGSRWGAGAVVSNLFVTVNGGLSRADLRKKLLELAAQRGRDHGIVVRRIGNPGTGNPNDMMSMLMAMQMGGGAGGAGPSLRAVEAYRVYADGREELIRNADITGLSASTFKEIVAASDSPYVHTTPFSARGTPVPGVLGYSASYVVPSVLFEDLTMRGPRGEIPKPPVAGHPFFDKP